ncbi:MAG: DUF222 domain-containing protein [bacterium]|nr:DUF222 domain-containing protein [bacterium]
MFGNDLDWVPENLERVPPGYVLAAMLDDIDIETCSGYDRIRVLRAEQRMASHYGARSYGTMTAVVDVMTEDPDEADFAEEAAAAEIRAALRLTRRMADVELSFALEMRRRAPLVWEALVLGSIDVRRARVIVNGTVHLSDAEARDVVDHVIADAGQLTTGQLGAKVRKLCLYINPQEAKARYENAVDDRRIQVEPTESGTSNLLGINLPPHRLAAGLKRINELARSLSGPGEARTMDQRRADVLLDLLQGTGQATGGGSAIVDLQTDLTTLAELADNPGELAGYGSVIADVARQVAKMQPDAEWRWTVIDPDTGRPMGTGTTRRRPTASQTRQVQARDRTCIFPGCRMPAIGCDIDHRIPCSEQGPTEVDFLAPACRYDHVTIRHGMGWTYIPLDNGDYQWTSRLGHTYTTSGQPP